MSESLISTMRLLTRTAAAVAVAASAADAEVDAAAQNGLNLRRAGCGRGEWVGLGLAVVYGIVKAHGGDIKVRSEIDKGTAIHVYLPLADRPAETASPEAERNYPTGTERILFVDDEEMVARVGSMMHNPHPSYSIGMDEANPFRRYFYCMVMGMDAMVKAGIARTFQVTRPFGEMTCLENVAVGVVNRQPGCRRSQWTALAAECLEAVGLTDMAATEARHLNVVQKKKLEIARALATRPELLMLDEVLGGLNSQEVQEAVLVLGRGGPGQSPAGHEQHRSQHQPWPPIRTGPHHDLPPHC